MSVELQRFTTGDTNYIQKHNSNLEALEITIAALEALASNSAAASGANVAGAFRALFGASASLIGAQSYQSTGEDTTLTVQAGYFWRPSLSAVVSKATSTTLNFTGVSAGTWYITPDATGSPIRTDSNVEAAYSVVWTGTEFGAITRLAPIVFGATDDAATQTSTALDETFASLDERLEAGEAKAAAGDLARTYVTGRLSKSIAGGDDVALTELEANNMELVFTGTVTADIDVSITLVTAPRAWLALNSTAGGKKITLKGSGGDGVALPPGSAVWVYSDGTNILRLPRVEVMTLTYAASVTADFSRADTIKMTLSGDSTITLDGAVDKQKCVLELKQDATGGREITLINHRLGSDLTEIVLSADPDKTDKIGLIYDAAAGAFDVVALARGF